ncbi:MAG: YdiY family protein [Pyrinomonadaceae bacterium]
MRTTVLLTFLLCLILCQEARADQVVLKNGDKLSGKIVKSDGKSLIIKTEFAGEVTVVWEAVTEVTSDEPLYLALADGRTVSGTVVMSGGQFEVRDKNARTVTAARARVQAIRSAGELAALDRLNDPGLFELWTGNMTAGLSLAKGNAETTNFALGASAARTTRRDKTTLYAASIYGRDSSSGFSRTTASAMRAGARYERNINRKWFGYGFTDLEHDDFQALNLRVVPGAGLGYRAIRSERTQLDLYGGAAWNKEFYRGDFNDRSSLEAQVGEDLIHRLSPRTTLKERLVFFPNLTDTGEYRINFDTGLATDITRRIGFQITVSDRYLSNPLPGLKKNDLLLTTGITAKFGK